jgi:predicted dehydrogenase
MLQLGIIGCGRVTTMFHLRALEILDDIEVVALSDINKTRLDDLTRKTNVQKNFTDYRKLIKDPEVNSVVINTPPQYHSQMVLDSLAEGKHVLCEKPLAQDIEDLERIKLLKEDYNLIVLPAHNYAFSPCLDLAQNLYENLGEISYIEVLFKNNLKSYRSLTNFRTSSNRGIVEAFLPYLLSVIMPLNYF